MGKQVVAHFKGGRVLKGTSLFVDPGRPTFELQPPEAESVEVTLADLKALFFVRSLTGDADYEENSKPDPRDPRSRGATVVRLEFEDGEVIVGLTSRYPPESPFYFIVPVDRRSNNVRILVNRDAVVLSEAIALG